MTKQEKAYVHAFIAAELICWSPLKLLGYAAPWIVLVIFLVESNSGRTLVRLATALALWLGWIGLRATLNPNFLLTPAILTIATYSTLFFILAVPLEGLSRRQLIAQCSRWAPALIIGEGCFGILQAVVGAAQTGSFDLSNGDRVQGTIFPFFRPDNSFSNPMYAVNMVFLLLLVLPRAVEGRRWSVIALGIGSVALVCASVIHVLLFATVGVAVSYMLYRPRLPKRLLNGGVGLFALLLPALAFSLLRANLEMLPRFAVAMAQGQYPRAEAIVRTVTRLPVETPVAPWVGLGPGQFSSRAALIGTGYYFGGIFSPRPLPLLTTGISDAFRQYMLDLWVQTQENPWLGSTHQPFFSWLSVYTEFGVPALLGIFLLAYSCLRQVQVGAQDGEQRLLAFTFGVGCILLLALGWQENYWEVPQAILPGAVLLKLLYAHLRTKTMPADTLPMGLPLVSGIAADRPTGLA